MSEVAGRMSIQEGAKYLERPQMGRGILLGGVPGVAPAHVVVLGGGVVGTNAAKVAAGLGANVMIMDINLDRLRYLDEANRWSDSWPPREAGEAPALPRAVEFRIETKDYGEITRVVELVSSWPTRAVEALP